MNVFIVEDSAPVQQIMSDTVIAQGGNVVGIVDTAEAAMDSILSAKPDFIILDLLLKQGSSMNVVRMVKRQLPLTKIIVMTNQKPAIYMQRCLDAGVDYFLQKNAGDYRRLRELLATATPYDT